MQSPPPTPVPSLTCPQFKPSVSGAVEIGVAASPTFRARPSGPFVSETVHAYATRAQQAAVWRTIDRPGLRRCAAASLRYGAGGGVHIVLTGRRRLSLPPLPAPVTGYRVSGTASLSYQMIDVYLDLLVLGRGRTIVELALSSFEQPPSGPLEARLARAVLRRMSAR